MVPRFFRFASTSAHYLSVMNLGTTAKYSGVKTASRSGLREGAASHFSVPAKIQDNPGEEVVLLPPFKTNFLNG